MEKFIVDRLEGEYAVCEKEDKSFLDIPLKHLPDGVKEGNILIFEKGNYRINSDETRIKRQEVSDLLDSILG